ncbi:unnamed protein product [Amoebophrya sp. A25]|nr:unnamed protein product [Amoebophrya sp. A25]|eukprot:GSA25T00023887001.1
MEGVDISSPAERLSCGRSFITWHEDDKLRECWQRIVSRSRASPTTPAAYRKASSSPSSDIVRRTRKSVKLQGDEEETPEGVRGLRSVSRSMTLKLDAEEEDLASDEELELDQKTFEFTLQNSDLALHPEEVSRIWHVLVGSVEQKPLEPKPLKERAASDASRGSNSPPQPNPQHPAPMPTLSKYLGNDFQDVASMFGDDQTGRTGVDSRALTGLSSSAGGDSIGLRDFLVEEDDASSDGTRRSHGMRFVSSSGVTTGQRQGAHPSVSSTSASPKQNTTMPSYQTSLCDGTTTTTMPDTMTTPDIETSGPPSPVGIQREHDEEEELVRTTPSPGSQPREVTTIKRNGSTASTSRSLNRQDSAVSHAPPTAVTFCRFRQAALRAQFLRNVLESMARGPTLVTSFAVPEDYDYSRSTEENYALEPPSVEASSPGSNVFFGGPWDDIRRKMDYSYHAHYSELRQQWQDRVVASTIRKSEPIHRPWLIYSGGAMGAGKGYVMRWLSATGYVPMEQCVRIDPDLFKTLMPEFDHYIERGFANEAGTMCHKESGALQELCLEAALRRSQNVWVDGSLRNADWVVSQVQDIRKRFPHYRIAVVFVYAPEEVVRRRVKARGEKTGRFVPEKELAESLQGSAQSVDKLVPHVDVVARVRNEDFPMLESLERVDYSGDFSRMGTLFAPALAVSIDEYDPDWLHRFPFRLPDLRFSILMRNVRLVSTDLQTLAGGSDPALVKEVCDMGRCHHLCVRLNGRAFVVSPVGIDYLVEDDLAAEEAGGPGDRDARLPSPSRLASTTRNRPPLRAFVVSASILSAASRATIPGAPGAAPDSRTALTAGGRQDTPANASTSSRLDGHHHQFPSLATRRRHLHQARYWRAKTTAESPKKGSSATAPDVEANGGSPLFGKKDDKSKSGTAVTQNPDVDGTAVKRDADEDRLPDRISNPKKNFSLDDDNPAQRAVFEDRNIPLCGFLHFRPNRPKVARTLLFPFEEDSPVGDPPYILEPDFYGYLQAGKEQGIDRRHDFLEQAPNGAGEGGLNAHVTSAMNLNGQVAIGRSNSRTLSGNIKTSSTTSASSTPLSPKSRTNRGALQAGTLLQQAQQLGLSSEFIPVLSFGRSELLSPNSVPAHRTLLHSLEQSGRLLRGSRLHHLFFPSGLVASSAPSAELDYDGRGQVGGNIYLGPAQQETTASRRVTSKARDALLPVAMTWLLPGEHFGQDAGGHATGQNGGFLVIFSDAHRGQLRCFFPLLV